MVAYQGFRKVSVGENAVKVLVDVDSDCVCWVVLELFVGGGVVKVFKAELVELGYSHHHHLASFVAFCDHDV